MGPMDIQTIAGGENGILDNRWKEGQSGSSGEIEGWKLDDIRMTDLTYGVW